MLLIADIHNGENHLFISKLCRYLQYEFVVLKCRGFNVRKHTKYLKWLLSN